jgi:hypothetical protein
MNDVPDEGRDTTGQGRARGPNRNRTPWETCSVPRPSSCVAKSVSLVPCTAGTECKGGEKRSLRGRGFTTSGRGLDLGRGPSDPGRGPEAAHEGVPTGTTENERRGGGGAVAGRCAIQSCGAEAEKEVAHPYRPEPSTSLCRRHARRARSVARGGRRG